MGLEVEDSYSAEIEDHINVILEKCAGLPLALSIANRWILNEVGTNSTSIDRAVQLYTEELNNLPHEYHEEFQEVDRILLTTLHHLEKWSRSTVVQTRYAIAKAVEMTAVIDSFCVMEKQAQLISWRAQAFLKSHSVSKTHINQDSL